MAKCKPKAQEKDYSSTFIEYIEHHGFFISNDSIFQETPSSESANFIYAFPLGLQKNKTYLFKNDSSVFLELKHK